MYTIIMTNDKQLVTTAQTTIYQKDNLVDKVQFLFPPKYGNLNLADCSVIFNYCDSANTVHNLELVMDDVQYKDKLRYHFAVCGDITKFAGSIVGHVVFTYADEEGGEIRILHTGETAITILPSKDFNSYDDEGSSSDLESRVESLENKVDELFELVEELAGIRHASTLNEINEALNDDFISTVILNDDIYCDDPSGICLSNGSDKTIDLNGYDVTGLCDVSDASCAAFYVTDGTLTIKGNGNVLGGRGCHSDVAVWSHGATAKVIIKGGNYNTEVDYQGDYSDVIYANASGSIEIYDGYFDNESHAEYTGPQRYVLNIQNNSGSTITCYGGSYVEQNPADGDDKDTATGSTFLADGYTIETTEQDGHVIYTVIKDN